MRALFLTKLLFFASNVTLIILVLLSIKFFANKPNRKFNDTVEVFNYSVKDSKTSADRTHNQRYSNKTEFKYILQWTSPRNVPFNSMGVGRSAFTSRNCPYTNCIVTSEKSYFSSVTEFDVIAFAGPEIAEFPEYFMPDRRARHQKYVFASIESAENYPVCSDRFDGFFNWTWTYKLDSDLRWGYMDVKDSYNNIIGPNKIMHWLKLEDMKPVSEEFKTKLKTKNKAAAWMVSNCNDMSGRHEFSKALKAELEKYKLELDIYGNCGELSCPRSNDAICMQMLREKYFFYLSFENSFSEDYVTEKLLKALQNNVVPIVFGGANYTR